MRSLAKLLVAAAALTLAPATVLAQPTSGTGTSSGPWSFTPVDPRGAPQNDPTLTGRPTTIWQGSRQFTPSIDFLRFNSNSRDRWYPSYSYNGGQTFTRDPGAFSGRADRAHAARVMTAEEYRRHQELANWQPGTGVILLRGEQTGAAGLNAGGFRDGRMVLAEGGAGYIALDVLRAEGGVAGDLQVNGTDGLILSGNAGTRLTVVGVTGQTSRGQLGGRGLGADIQATGRAGVGAEATATGNLSVGPNGLRARVGGEAFAGARASGEIPVGVSLLGVRFSATGRGNVSAGAGINGNAYAGAGNGGIRCGAELGGCLGVGAGAGVDLEIDASGMLDFFDNLGGGGGYQPREDFRPRIVGPAGPGMVRVSTVNCIGSRCTQLWTEEQARTLRERDDNEYRNLSAFFAQPRTGNQSGRYSNTRVNDRDLEMLRQWIQSNGNAGPAAGAGRLRD